MGDFSAHPEADNATYTFHSITDSKGKLMIDFLQETNLMIGNNSFTKKKGKLWTYISDMNGLKSQVDYILINQIISYYLKNRNDFCKKGTTGCNKKRSLTWNRK